MWIRRSGSGQPLRYMESCVRPAFIQKLTFRLLDVVGFPEAAMVEPLAVGVHAASKARIRPGDIATVLGAGPIGLVTALASLAAGCARVYVTDLAKERLRIAESPNPAITAVDSTNDSVANRVLRNTDGWGADVVFEATGSPHAATRIFEPLCPSGCVVMIGGQPAPIAYDAGAAMVREARVENIFRYAHAFPRCVAMLASGAIDVKPLITKTFGFDESVRAFEVAASAPPSEVKMQIELSQ